MSNNDKIYPTLTGGIGANITLRSLVFYIARGFVKALVVGVLCGFIGVLLDFDHIVCVLLGYAPWLPEQGIYGCRLFHNLYLLTGISGVVIGVTLGIGLFSIFILSAIRFWIIGDK